MYLNSLQTQPFTEGFHPAIPQGILAGLRIAVGGRTQESSDVLRGVPTYLRYYDRRFKRNAPSYCSNRNTLNRRMALPLSPNGGSLRA